MSFREGNSTITHTQYKSWSYTVYNSAIEFVKQRNFQLES